MAALPVRGQVGIVAESMTRVMEELNAATERMIESNRRLAERTTLGRIDTAGAGHTHNTPPHSHAVPYDDYPALRQQVQDLQNRLAESEANVAQLRNLVRTPPCDPNASRCCSINFVTEDSWFCHVVMKHVGVEDARRLLSQFPDPVELMEVTRRKRRHLGSEVM